MTLPPAVKPHFLEDLAALKQQIAEQGDLVESRVAAAMRGLFEGDFDLLDEVSIGDGDVNALQITIDDRAFKLLALHQPVALDLRVIVAAIKINSELERVGDLAVNIAEAARRYFAAGRLAGQEYLPRMADIAESMLQSALNAFAADNIGVAQSVLERDDALDTLRMQANRRLLGLMTHDSSAVAAANELLLIVRHLERIGDHATNIAEDVFFIVAGEDVRHHAKGA
jgi:phosphate transport system protein